jgi:membrane-associated phospholipid phosphatase
MKTKLYTTLFSFLIVTAVTISCNKDVDVSEQLSASSPTNLDQDAETWAPVDPNVMTLAKIKTAVEVTTAPPIFNPGSDMAAVQNVNSDAYVAELAAIKDAQSKLTGKQKEIIEYWSGGGVLRWNQILREMVARYNLPPEPVQGAYPAPDAENPFGFPQFPFSNPPYASRAYSYVSIAQYEALKTAWHYMYLYNRPAPYTNDSGVKALVPKTDLPAYPSYDAVLSGVSAEMLKLLFPASVEEITLKAAEQRNAALWSGKASSTDIAKGLALGKAVANIFITRARGDGMGTAGGNKVQWKQLETNATDRGEIPWKSLETPARPPMLPVFGSVKGWMMTPANFVAERPLPPPPTSSSEMINEVKEVKWYTTHLTRERLAIVHKWADGAGTYTPAGHWNDIAAEHIRDANYSEVRTARAFALLNMTMHDAAVACWDAKFFYFNPRPSQLDPDIKTGTGVPNFPAYVSGHSTYSAAASAVLAHMFPSHAEEFLAMAEEAAMSRLYGGIHYMSDCTAGTTLGLRVGEYTITFADGDGADD